MSYPLKYLFTAIFSDGSTISQTEPDISVLNPSKTKFFDVQQREEDIYSFSLREIDGTNEISVCLLTGKLTINGVNFSVQDPSVEFPKDLKYRLIYFRRVKRTTGFDAQGNIILPLEGPVEYHIGWQTTIDGKNYQQTVAVT